MKILLMLAKTLEKQKLNFSRSALFHMKTRVSIKTGISDHFAIFFGLNTCEKSKPEDKAQFIYKRIYEEKQIQLFKHETLDNPNTAYESFFDKFFKTYDKYFPKVRIKIKAKTIQNPWITKGITKSSKKKQKLYERFLKKRTPQNEQKYKNYKNLFETIKKKGKKIYYSNKLLKCSGC